MSPPGSLAISRRRHATHFELSAAELAKLTGPDRQELAGFRLVGDTYQPIAPDRQGRLRSDVLGLDLGFWEGLPRAQGVRPKEKATWLRLFRPDGRLVPTAVEARDAKVEAAEARAEAAEAELKRLRS